MDPRPFLCPSASSRTPLVMALQRRRLIYLFHSCIPPPPPPDTHTHVPLYVKRNLLILGKSGWRLWHRTGAQAAGGGAGWHCWPWPGLCPRNVCGSEPRPGLVTYYLNLSWEQGRKSSNCVSASSWGWRMRTWVSLPLGE